MEGPVAMVLREEGHVPRGLAHHAFRALASGRQSVVRSWCDDQRLPVLLGEWRDGDVAHVSLA